LANYLTIYFPDFSLREKIWKIRRNTAFIMNRRSFLSLAGSAALSTAAGLLLPQARAGTAIDRTSKWAPSNALLLGVEWRYAAGRIADNGQDYGFVACLIDGRAINSQELLVQHQDFTGDKLFRGQTYSGALVYDQPSATYTFRDAQQQTLATWQWDQAAEVYKLTVTTAELNLQNIALVPQSDLIPEGGNGVIDQGKIAGVPVVADYYADWTVITIGGAAKGVARIDMEGLRPATQVAGKAQPDWAQAIFQGRGRSEQPTQAVRPSRATTAAADDRRHDWFAVAAELDGMPIWISAWRVDTQGGPFWGLTIAQGSGQTWQATSLTEKSAVVVPLTVGALAWQAYPEIPGSAQNGRSTRVRWRFRAGEQQPDDLIDLEVEVPPGQFATSAGRVTLGNLTVVEEGIGIVAQGTVRGQPLSNPKLVVGESSAGCYLQYIPVLNR
jgi:hypothetical protein